LWKPEWTSELIDLLNVDPKKRPAAEKPAKQLSL
jgi:hypothetical protein